MRRCAVTLTLAAATALLGGCVYNPYTGLWQPCCSYNGYPYAYRYPATPYYPYGYAPGPYGGPAAGYPGQPLGPAGWTAPAVQGTTLDQSFAAANVAHDGRLTRAQAQAAMPAVAQNFDAIDFDQKGYVTLPEVRAFMAQRQVYGGQPGQAVQY